MLEEARRDELPRYSADTLPAEDDLLGLKFMGELYGMQSSPPVEASASQEGGSDAPSDGGSWAGAHAVPIVRPHQSQGGVSAGLNASGSESQVMPGMSPATSSMEGSQHFTSLYSGALNLSGVMEPLPQSASMSSSSTDIWGLHHGNGSNHGAAAFGRQPEGGGMWMQGVPPEDHTLHGGATYGLSMRHSASDDHLAGHIDGDRQRMLPAGALSLLGLKAAPPPPPPSAPKAPLPPPPPPQQQPGAAGLAGAGEHPLGEHPSRTLFVRNINWSVEEVELRQLFESYGEVRAVYTACKHRGFVMISYFDLRSAKAAMRALQGRLVRRRRLDIHYSIPKDNPNDRDINQGTLVVFNLDSSIGNEELQRLFGTYGEVKEIRETPRKKNHKFVEYYDIRAAATALHCLNHVEVAGKRIKLEPSRPGGARRSALQQQTRQMMEDEKRSMLHTPVFQSPWNMDEAALRQRQSLQVQDSMHLYTAPAAPVSALQHFETLHQQQQQGMWAGLSLEEAAALQQSLPGASQSDLVALGLLAQQAVEQQHALSAGQPINIGGVPRAAGDEWLRSGAVSAPGELSSLGSLLGALEMGTSPSNTDASSQHYHPAYSMSPGSSMWSASSYAPSAPSSNNPSGHGMMMANEHAGSHSQHGPTSWGSHMGIPHHLDPFASSSQPSLASLGDLPQGLPARTSSASDLMSSAMAQSTLELQRNLENGTLDLQELLVAAQKGHLLEAQLRAQQQQFDMSHHQDKTDKSGRSLRRGASSGDPTAEAQRKAAQQKMFNLDLERVARGEDHRTTLMIKNIPNKYTQKMLLATIDELFRGTYDFFYLPIDFKNKCNMGYAFINMVRPQGIIPLVERFDRKKWEKFNSEKVCSIAYARIQGKAALISHFQNSSLMHEDKHCRPIIFASNGIMAGIQEPFPVGNNVRARTSRTSTTGGRERDVPPSVPQMVPRGAHKGSMSNLLQAAQQAEEGPPCLAPISSSF